MTNFTYNSIKVFTVVGSVYEYYVGQCPPSEVYLIHIPFQELFYSYLQSTVIIQAVFIITFNISGNG